MPRPATRRHALFMLVVSPGPFVIMKGPEGFTPWPVIRKALLKVMREEHGIKAADVSCVEGLADPRTHDPHDLEAADKLAATFAGAEGFRAFHLYAWTGDAFALVRKPLDKEST